MRKQLLLQQFARFAILASVAVSADTFVVVDHKIWPVWQATVAAILAIMEFMFTGITLGEARRKRRIYRIIGRLQWLWLVGIAVLALFVLADSGAAYLTDKRASCTIFFGYLAAFCITHSSLLLSRQGESIGT